MTYTLKQLRDDYNRRVKSEKDFRGFPARMGRADNVVDAGDGNVYIVTLDGQTFSIPNRRLPLGVKGIFIGTTPEDPDTVQVLSTWEVYDKPWPAGVVPHAPQHNLTGFDPDWIEIERVRWMLILPKRSLGAFYVQLYGGHVSIGGSVITVDNQTLNLAANKPTTGALYALIQINSSGIINAKIGTPVASKQLLTNADIPTVDADNFADCAIALYDAQKKIQRDTRMGRTNDFVDLRFANAQGGGTGTTDHAALSHLAYADSGHTGFEPAKGADDNYVTDAEKSNLHAPGDTIIWEIITADQTMVVNHGYIANKGTLLTLLLPATAAVNDIVRVSGMGSGGWAITQGAGQQIHFGNQDTTSGAGGSLASVHIRDAVELICCVADVEFNVISSVGNITIV